MAKVKRDKQSSGKDGSEQAGSKVDRQARKGTLRSKKLATKGGVEKLGKKAGKKAKTASDAPKKVRKTRADKAAVKQKNSKDLPRFWAVKAGRVPGVYTNLARFQAQIEGFSGAVSKRFRNRKDAEKFVGDAAAQADEAPSRESAAPFGSFASVKYDRSLVPKGFTLGHVRAFGRSVLSAAAAPSFGVFGPTAVPAAAEEELPHHRQLAQYQKAADDMPLDRQGDLGDQVLAMEAAPESAVNGVGEAEAVGRPADSADDTPPDIPRGIATDSSDEEGEVEEKAEELGQVRWGSGEVVGQKRKRGVVDVEEGGEGDSADDASGDDSDDAGLLDGDFIALYSPRVEENRGGAAAEDSADDATPCASDALGDGGPKAKTSWEEWELPWYASNLHIGSQSLRLHNEIVELTSLLQPTDKEDAQRHDAFALVEGVVKEVFPGATLQVFGSFGTGLHLPTSDVDCVILDADISAVRVPTALQGLGRALAKKEWISNLEVITKAKVPIVKLVVMPVGLKFDISVGKSNGLDAVELIKTHLAAWPALKPLVTILKLFLLQRNMNEVYTGGLGSFALIISVVAFLQLHQSRTRGIAKAKGRGAEAGQLDSNLGLLLVDYFRFYGRQLKYQDVGVTCAEGGFCYVKRLKGFGRDARDRGDRYSLMDPLDSSNDTSRGSFNTWSVRDAFDHAYNMLTTTVQRKTSLLGTILRLNDVLAIRPPPPKAKPRHLELQHGGRAKRHDSCKQETAGPERKRRREDKPSRSGEARQSSRRRSSR